MEEVGQEKSLAKVTSKPHPQQGDDQITLISHSNPLCLRRGGLRRVLFYKREILKGLRCYFRTLILLPTPQILHPGRSLKPCSNLLPVSIFIGPYQEV